MSRDFDFTPRASQDIRRIVRWLRKRSQKGAASWLRSMWQAALNIAEDAERYGYASEADNLTEPVREALFKTRRGRRYRIIFVFTDSKVRILRVRRPGERPLRDRDLRRD